MTELTNNFNEFIKKMKKIQEVLLEFIDKNESAGYDCNEFIDFLKHQKIQSTRYELSSLLHLFVHLSNYHFRYPLFFSKIEKAILSFKDVIQKNFTQMEIFYIFRSNKRLLLFLFEQRIITPNETIATIFCSEKYQKKFYPQYFFPEFKSFFEKEILENAPSDEISNDKRKIGENDYTISQFIRNDSIEEFISFINQNNISLNAKITPSIYETNSFLLKNNPSLIEYAAFHGSIMIFHYLMNNHAVMTPDLWLYSIHGQNPEIIQYIENNQIEPPTEKTEESNAESENQIQSDEIYRKCYNEAIKCHQNDIKNYIEQNFDQSKLNKKPNLTNYKLENKNDFRQIVKIVKYFNYSYFPDLEDCISFEFFCLAQNGPLVELFLTQSKIDVNSRIESDENGLKQQKSLLSFAAQFNNPEIVNFLLNQPNIDLNCVPTYSFEKGDEKSPYISYNADETTPLATAIDERNFENAQLLLNHPKLEINKMLIYKSFGYEASKLINQITIKGTAFFAAVRSENFDVFKLFLKRNDIDINCHFTYDKEEPEIPQTRKDVITPLFLLIEKENVPMIKLLLSRPDIDVNKISVNTQITDILYPYGFRDEFQFNHMLDGKLAYSSGYYRDEYKYYKNGYYKREVYSEGKEEFPPLTYAVTIGNMEILNLLLERPDINVNVKSILYQYFNKYYDKIIEGSTDSCDSKKSSRNYDDLDDSKYNKVKIKIKNKYSYDKVSKYKKYKPKNTSNQRKKTYRTKEEYIYEEYKNGSDSIDYQSASTDAPILLFVLMMFLYIILMKFMNHLFFLI